MPTPAGRRRHAPRGPGKLIGLAGIAAVIALGGIGLYMNGPQTGPYRLQSLTTEEAAQQADGASTVPKSLSFLVEIPERGGLEIAVRGGGEAVTISEVRLDGTAAGFTVEPAGPIAPGASARIRVDHSLAIGEARNVALVTTAGQVFSREIGRIESALYSTRFGGEPPAP